MLCVWGGEGNQSFSLSPRSEGLDKDIYPRPRNHCHSEDRVVGALAMNTHWQ